LKNMKTRKAIITRTLAVAIIAGGMFTGCMSQAQKEEAARAKVEDAREDLNDAKVEANRVALKTATAEEWRIFKNESDLKFKENEARIAELRVQLNRSGTTLDHVYAQRIETLEEKNRGMRNRMTVYENNKSDWETFKREFTRDMEALGNSFKDVVNVN
jgi:predicted RNase H-like nuclease (RuvC/YqgF family)